MQLFARIWEMITKIVFHTEVLWLSNGNKLSRHFKPKHKVKNFLQRQKTEAIYDANTDETFHLSLVFLVNVFDPIKTPKFSAILTVSLPKS